MPSRSNSSAGDRLRRAKSTSSAHTIASAHQRTKTATYPEVTERHAEIAAVEAFKRLRPDEEALVQIPRSTPSKLQRRRSQVTGKTEGGHFEDARLGRRKSTSRKDASRKPDGAVTRQQNLRCAKKAETQNTARSDGKVITRRRSVIPPLIEQAPSTTTSTRKGDICGSPIPRYQSTLKHEEARPSWYLRAQEHRDSTQPGNVCDPIIGTERAINGLGYDTKPLTTLTSNPTCQGTSQKALRERRSFITGTLQRLRGPSTQKGEAANYDTSLPPFNHALSDLAPEFFPQSSPLPQELAVGTSELRPRSFSESLRSRLRKAFRKVSRTQDMVPVQHIKAKQIHYPIISLEDVPLPSAAARDDPFISFDVPEPAAHIVSYSGSQRSNASGASAGEISAIRSRVTSWTNSTVAKSCSEADDNSQNGSVEANAVLKRSDSVSTLRKASSILGKSLKTKLWRPSKIQLNTSVETANLYSALQERINPANEIAPSEKTDAGHAAPSDLSTLPSQQKRVSDLAGRSLAWTTKTIRPVTPDIDSRRIELLSPVAEVLSPPHPITKSEGPDLAHREITPKTQLQRRSAIKAPTPSKEQIAQRMERSKNRWQATLDEISPLPTMSKRLIALDDNPYELRSLSRRFQHIDDVTDVPYHAHIGDIQEHREAKVLSPSLYSRGSYGGTPPPPQGTNDINGMMVTITGHEVRSFPISPAKSTNIEKSVQSSREWRRWLSGELKQWNSALAGEEVELSQEDTKIDHTNDSMDRSTNGKETFPTPSPVMPTADIDAKQLRQRAKLRKSSFMNERYPILNPDKRMGESTAENKHNSSADSELQNQYVSGSQCHAFSGCNKSRESNAQLQTTELKVVSKRRSALEMTSAQRKALLHQTKADTASTVTLISELRNGRIISAVDQQSSTNRAKSALNLHAKYTSGKTSAPKPIEVRRKELPNRRLSILEDDTIRKISAGPYASPQNEAGTATASTFFRKPSTNNNENTPPLDPKSMRTVSSSNWLAGAFYKQKAGHSEETGAQEKYRNYNATRCSPLRTGKGDSGGDSPGQRMVTGWLDAKKSKENSPAVFI